MPTTDDLLAWKDDPLRFAEALELPTAAGTRRFGEVMADFQRERFRALAPDLQALANQILPPRGRHWWEATKGASKDTDLAVAVIWLLAFSSRPFFGQIGAADKDQAAELRRAATAVLRANPWLGERVVADKFRISRLNGTGDVEILPADPAGSHGARPDLVILNELHAMYESGRVCAENLMDNADKMQGHNVRVIATNAGFQNTWQWQWREYARQSSRWYFHKWDTPAPWIATADVDEARVRNSTTRFQRLWLGVWATASGDAIEPADIQAAITLAGPQDGPEPGWVYAAGLDLSTKRHHSALVVLGTRPGTGRVSLVACQSWAPGANGMVDLVAVRGAVQEAAVRFDLACVAFDPYQAALMAQELQAVGVPMLEVTFYGRTLNRMATAIIEAFRSRMLDLYPDRPLVDDLLRLTIAEGQFGYKLKAAADAAGHADRAIAMSIILPAMMEVANAEADGITTPADRAALPTAVYAP